MRIKSSKRFIKQWMKISLKNWRRKLSLREKATIRNRKMWPLKSRRISRRSNNIKRIRRRISNLRKLKTSKKRRKSKRSNPRK